MARAHDEGGGAWLRAETEHITLETDLDRDDARKLARDLENWRTVMATVLFPGAKAAQHLRVITLANRELEPLNPMLHGLFIDVPYVGPALLLGASFSSDRSRIMKHELAHAMIAENFHEPPQWLNEGLAVYLETTALDETTGHVTWGSPAAVGPFDRTAARMSATRVLSSQSWSASEMGDMEQAAGHMVHMLANRHPAEFSCLLARLSRFDEFRPALDACFGKGRDWTADFARDRLIPASSADVAMVGLYAGEPRIASMPDADVHALLALVNAGVSATCDPNSEARNRLADDYQYHLRRALELDPSQILAASLELGPEIPDGDRRGELTARLVKAHPEDWRAWHWRAAVFSTNSGVARQALAMACRLAPNRADVIRLLAQDAVLSGDWKEAAGLALRAFRLWPESASNRALMVMTLAHLVEPSNDLDPSYGSSEKVAERLAALLENAKPARIVIARQRSSAVRGRPASL